MRVGDMSHLMLAPACFDLQVFCACVRHTCNIGVIACSPC